MFWHGRVVLEGVKLVVGRPIKALTGREGQFLVSFSPLKHSLQQSLTVTILTWSNSALSRFFTAGLLLWTNLESRGLPKTIKSAWEIFLVQPCMVVSHIASLFPEQHADLEILRRSPGPFCRNSVESNQIIDEPFEYCVDHGRARKLLAKVIACHGV